MVAAEEKGGAPGGAPVSERDRRCALAAGCVLLALAAVMLLGFGWKYPDGRDLPSVRLDALLHGQKAQRSVRAEVSEPADRTTQIPIFHNINQQRLLRRYEPTANLDPASLAPLPGLAHTLTYDSWELADVVETTMVPQGVAASGKYVFVSAYDGSHAANSVVYVMDRATGELVKTLVLAGQSHVGGLAYDDRTDHLWVATRRGKKAQVSSLALADIEAYEDGSTKPIAYAQQLVLAQPKQASFVEYFEGSLYVGYFTVEGTGSLYRYRLLQDGTLDQEVADQATTVSTLPPRAQGITFTTDYVLVSQSWGNAASTLYVYPNAGETTIGYVEALAARDLGHKPNYLFGLWLMGIELPPAPLPTPGSTGSAGSAGSAGLGAAGSAGSAGLGAGSAGFAGLGAGSGSAASAGSAGSASSAGTRGVSTVGEQSVGTFTPIGTLVARDYADEEPLATIEFPPMMEDLTIQGGDLIWVHESAAQVYRNRYGVGVDRLTNYPIDQILALAKGDGK